MSRRVLVKLGAAARPIGELVHENDGHREHSVFTYDPQWQAAPDAFPLSPQLPLKQGRFHMTNRASGLALPAVMMDGAPDSWGRAIIRHCLDRWCDDLDYLLEADDCLRTGALRYFDEDGTALAPPRQNSIPHLASMVEIVAAARQFEANPETCPRNWAKLLQAAGSLGGARPKVSVLDEQGVLWIAKFARTGDTLAVAKGEVLVLQLARSAGLRAATARLVHVGGDYPVALIRRFDRLPDGTRRHFMSAQTLLGIAGAAAGDYVAIADALRQHGREPLEQMAELHRRLLFTILVSNVDDHLRNHGLLYAGTGRWILSPAYDINPEPVRGTWLKTAISEIHGFKPSIESAIDAAPLFDIKTDVAASEAKKMATYIRDNWRGLASRLRMSTEEIKAYAPAFEHPELHLALRYGGQAPSRNCNP